MKKAIGSILCVVAILLVIGKIIPSKPETTAHKVQDWAVIGVLLAIGIPLSQAKKKSKESN